MNYVMPGSAEDLGIWEKAVNWVPDSERGSWDSKLAEDRRLRALRVACVGWVESWRCKSSQHRKIMCLSPHVEKTLNSKRWIKFSYLNQFREFCLFRIPYVYFTHPYIMGMLQRQIGKIVKLYEALLVILRKILFIYTYIHTHTHSHTHTHTHIYIYIYVCVCVNEWFVDKVFKPTEANLFIYGGLFLRWLCTSNIFFICHSLSNSKMWANTLWVIFSLMRYSFFPYIQNNNCFHSVK